ncbi:MAG TPA: MBL fold metallo-hydrolase [Gemmatimonadales bacterium]|jgi:7,8-dihydropterin-6-yl-methyl-4-(beta-D-ribofuranosyl)aminobenzene 5'-phosphate synthase|nr:MBL fold metallo-hydrolase [Gemmatimonadales bacterium]
MRSVLYFIAASLVLAAAGTPAQAAAGTRARAAAGTPARAAPSPPARVTILYDAFGDRPGLTPDWGFAALVEYGGHRILFDAGNDGGVFARNVRALKVDLRHLDFAVISHRHGDHTGGLPYLLRINPTVKIYAPYERFGLFGGPVPTSIIRPDTALPRRMRYFAGAVPAQLRSSTVWPTARFVTVDTLTEVAPGIALVSTVSRTPGTLELHELSLVLRTPKGLIVLVGCSHPGIETILDAAQAYGGHVHEILGGFHLVATPDAEIQRIATALHDARQLDLIAPGHCTGEPAFDILARVFGDRYVYAGLGTVVQLT